MALNYCPLCGTQIADNAQWCTNCGAHLANQAPEPAPAAESVSDPIQPKVQNTAPQPTVNQNPNVCPENHLTEAILVTLFCCMPFGILALVNANDVSSAFRSGNYDLAVEKSNTAKKWIKWALISGLIYIVGLAIYFVIYFVAMIALGEI